MKTTEESAVHAVARALGVPCATFDNELLRMEEGRGLEKLVPAAMARAWLVMPLFLDGETLALAAADPSDAVLLADVAKASGCKIQPFAAAKSELLAAIDRDYP